MATATASAPKAFNDAAKQVTQLNQRFLAPGKQVGKLYLGVYEKAVASATATERKLAEQSRVKFVQTLIKSHADRTSELAKTYTTAARKALR